MHPLSEFPFPLLTLVLQRSPRPLRPLPSLPRYLCPNLQPPRVHKIRLMSLNLPAKNHHRYCVRHNQPLATRLSPSSLLIKRSWLHPLVHPIRNLHLLCFQAPNRRLPHPPPLGPGPPRGDGGNRINQSSLSSMLTLTSLRPHGSGKKRTNPSSMSSILILGPLHLNTVRSSPLTCPPPPTLPPPCRTKTRLLVGARPPLLLRRLAAVLLPSMTQQMHQTLAGLSLWIQDWEIPTLLRYQQIRLHSKVCKNLQFLQCNPRVHPPVPQCRTRLLTNDY